MGESILTHNCKVDDPQVDVVYGRRYLNKEWGALGTKACSNGVYIESILFEAAKARVSTSEGYGARMLCTAADWIY